MSGVESVMDAHVKKTRGLERYLLGLGLILIPVSIHAWRSIPPEGATDRMHWVFTLTTAGVLLIAWLIRSQRKKLDDMMRGARKVRVRAWVYSGNFGNGRALPERDENADTIAFFEHQGRYWLMQALRDVPKGDAVELDVWIGQQPGRMDEPIAIGVPNGERRRGFGLERDAKNRMLFRHPSGVVVDKAGARIATAITNDDASQLPEHLQFGRYITLPESIRDRVQKELGGTLERDESHLPPDREGPPDV